LNVNNSEEFHEKDFKETKTKKKGKNNDHEHDHDNPDHDHMHEIWHEEGADAAHAYADREI
jgi:hypothetical protein